MTVLECASVRADHSEKVHILLEKLPHIRAAQALSPAAKIYVWWDFYSIRQTSANIHKVEKEAQILSIPIYLAASDTCIAFKAGDEEVGRPPRPPPCPSFCHVLAHHPGHPVHPMLCHAHPVCRMIFATFAHSGCAHVMSRGSLR